MSDRKWLLLLSATHKSRIGIVSRFSGHVWQRGSQRVQRAQRAIVAEEWETNLAGVTPTPTGHDGYVFPTLSSGRVGSGGFECVLSSMAFKCLPGIDWWLRSIAVYGWQLIGLTTEDNNPHNCHQNVCSQKHYFISGSLWLWSTLC